MKWLVTEIAAPITRRLGGYAAAGITLLGGSPELAMQAETLTVFLVGVGLDLTLSAANRHDKLPHLFKGRK